MSIRMQHRVPRDDLRLGLVLVRGVETSSTPGQLAAALDTAVRRRAAQPLSVDEEQVRGACRDLLRNGKYKPTGRGKPASEYLLRAAGEGSFPRINGPVDANNLVSLEYCVPISVWDVERAGTSNYEARLGRAGESYVFNASGQVLDLEDLLCGCGLMGEGTSVPLVNPVKDGMATKIQPTTRTVAGVIYYPKAGAKLEEATRALLRWLAACGSSTNGSWAICEPGASVELA